MKCFGLKSEQYFYPIEMDKCLLKHVLLTTKRSLIKHGHFYLKPKLECLSRDILSFGQDQPGERQ